MIAVGRQEAGLITALALLTDLRADCEVCDVTETALGASNGWERLAGWGPLYAGAVGGEEGGVTHQVRPTQLRLVTAAATRGGEVGQLRTVLGPGKTGVGGGLAHGRGHVHVHHHVYVGGGGGGGGGGFIVGAELCDVAESSLPAGADTLLTQLEIPRTDWTGLEVLAARAEVAVVVTVVIAHLPVTETRLKVGHGEVVTLPDTVLGLEPLVLVAELSLPAELTVPWRMLGCLVGTAALTALRAHQLLTIGVALEPQVTQGATQSLTVLLSQSPPGHHRTAITDPPSHPPAGVHPWL